MASLAAGLVGSLIPGLAGLFGGGQQQKVQTSGTISNQGTGSFQQGGTTSSTGASTQTGTTTPNLSPLQQALVQQFSKGASDLYNQSTNLNPYAAAGLQNINAGGDIANKVLQNSLAARGLSYSPAAANATTQQQLSTIGQGSQFLNSLPLLQRQLQQQSLGQLMQAFQVQPIGSTTTGAGTQTQQGTTQQSGSETQNNVQTQQGTNLVSGNPAAGAISGFGAGLAAPGPGGVSNLSNIIGKMFGGGGSAPGGTYGTGPNWDPNTVTGG
jgi:hypothetical protein